MHIAAPGCADARRACSMWSLKWRPNCSEESRGGFGAGLSCDGRRRVSVARRLRCACAAMQARMGTRRQLCRQQRGVEALIRLQGAKGGSTGGTVSAAVSAQHAAHTALEKLSAAHRESWRRRVRSAPRGASAAAPRAMPRSRKHRCTQPQSARPALTHVHHAPRRRARRAQEADTRVRRVLHARF
jgi:hypothetical protein